MDITRKWHDKLTRFSKLGVLKVALTQVFPFRIWKIAVWPKFEVTFSIWTYVASSCLELNRQKCQHAKIFWLWHIDKAVCHMIFSSLQQNSCQWICQTMAVIWYRLFIMTVINFMFLRNIWGAFADCSSFPT